MKKYKITIQDHHILGGLGLVVDTERGYFDPAFDGLSVAHDILEHPIRPHSCGYTDELMALGGYLAGRVEMRYKTTNGYKYVSIDDIELLDIRSLLNAALTEYGDNNPIAKIDKCRSYIKCEWTMNKLRELVKKGILDAINEWMDEDVDDIDSMNGGYDSRVDDYDIDSIVGWICKGHNLFIKRFNNINTYDLFDNIRKVSDNFLSNQIEGMSGTLFVEFSTGKVYIKEDYLD